MGALTAEAVAAGFQPVWIEDAEDLSKADLAAGMYRRMLLAVLLKMLERAERDPGYGYLDMKIDLITGQDFAANDQLRGKATIYGWIQGRGLEALAGHAKWVQGLTDGQIEGLGSAQRQEIVERISKVTRTLIERMETLREKCGGRLSFMMRESGEALRVVDGKVVPKENWTSSPANHSDLFYAKGLAAAAAFVGDQKRMEAAKQILQRILDDVRAERFTSDQEQLDVRNPVRGIPGRRSHGPRMILTGAAALMIELTRDPEWAKIGGEMVAAILARFINIHREGRQGEAHDMWEYVHGDGRQYLEEGNLLRSDPGHATEFVGFALKFLRVCEEHAMLKHAGLPPGVRGTLGKVLKKNFRNGFSRKNFGLCKAYDLVSRKPINTDMPWWNLPETIRAGMEAVAANNSGDDADRWQYADIVRQSSNAFMEYFVRADRWLMANQTIDENGVVAARVPATPDADPGYHTGLSLIDALYAYERLRASE